MSGNNCPSNIRETFINVEHIYYNPSPQFLYDKALKILRCCVSDCGALVVYSGEKTGRSPRDKRVVKDDLNKKDIWWFNQEKPNNSPNYEIDMETYDQVKQIAINHLNCCREIYVIDGFVNWSPVAKIKIRIITEYAYHALFMENMLIRLTPEDISIYGQPELVIYNAGDCTVSKSLKTMTSKTSICLDVSRGEMVILGTLYAGEMKKGLFSFIHYLMPKRNILSLHSGCNIGKENDVTLFFGLSGTGKTTLSTEPDRQLIGDDEHCWDDHGIFNIEGGCYAKCIGLKAESEPEIYHAIKFGSVLENVVIDPVTKVVNYASNMITDNTRACYPIDYITNARIPCRGGHPKNIILLCCDAFGVLPPVSHVTMEQAMYHFINGYTSKIAGTEDGIIEPEATFSACYGGAFLMWHPMKYSAMLAEKMNKYKTHAWLINTGWTGGKYGVGCRIKLSYTRAIINAIHQDQLNTDKMEYVTSPIFNLRVPKKCNGVPDEILHPHLSWSNQREFNETLYHLATLFHKNFQQYIDDMVDYVNLDLITQIKSGGPIL